MKILITLCIRIPLKTSTLLFCQVGSVYAGTLMLVPSYMNWLGRSLYTRVPLQNNYLIGNTNLGSPHINLSERSTSLRTRQDSVSSLVPPPLPPILYVLSLSVHTSPFHRSNYVPLIYYLPGFRFSTALTPHLYTR